MTAPSAADTDRKRRVGAYLFYAFCAYGVSLEAYAALRWLDLPQWLVTNGASIALIASFLALRDMRRGG